MASGRPTGRNRPSAAGRGAISRTGRRGQRGEWRSRPPAPGGRPPGGPPPRPQPAVDLSTLRGPEEELIAGRRPVEEAFAARRDAHRLIVVPERRAALEALVLHATTLRIPIVEVEGGTLTSLTGFDGHQGVALVVAARAPANLDDVLARARERNEPPFVLVLDSLEDPQNLGTMLRSAEACGVHGVVFPTRRSAPLSPAAIKASAGATEHLLLVPVDDLPATMVDMRTRGLRLVGGDEGAPMRYGEADLRGPLALVVGSEGYGISGALRRRLDQSVRIPMRGQIGSLNAAVAGSILLFAAADQRGTPESDEVVAAPPAEPEEATAPAKPTRPRKTAAAPPKGAPSARKATAAPARPSRSRKAAAPPAEPTEEDLLPPRTRPDPAPRTRHVRPRGARDQPR
jgi:23S rRNA (guanosine2251-2'-O)-methyltransferase